MKRKTASSFEVKRNETITITVTPISAGPFVAAAQNGVPLIDQSPTKKHFLFRFTITRPVGTVQVAKLIGQFMGQEPPKARYEIAIASDLGPTYSYAPMRKPSGSQPTERSRQFTFVVAP